MVKFRDTMLWLVINIGCFIFTYMVSNGDLANNNTRYNLVFLLVMFILYAITLFSCLFTISRLNTYFEACIEKLKGYKLTDGVRSVEKIQSLKGYGPIDKRIDGFLKDLANSQSGILDIQDYVNDDETDTIVKKWLLDWMPTVFVSLGLLGTFVGLVWGLKFFNTADFDTMTASVAELIDGIKVAFLTSIFGMVNSLGVSFSSSFGYSALQAKLQKFLDLFHANVIPSAEIEAQNIMVQTQRNQEDALRTMSSDFSDRMSDDTVNQEVQKINTSIEELGSTFDAANTRMTEEIVGALEQLRLSNEATEQAISSMSELNQGNIEAAEEQGELLRRLVESSERVEKLLGDALSSSEFDE